MTFVSALFSRTHFNANYFAVLNESFKVISLFSYQSSLFVVFATAFIFYQKHLSLSTTFLFFFVVVSSDSLFILSPAIGFVNNFFFPSRSLKMSTLNSTFFHVFIVLPFCTIRSLFYCIFSLLGSAIVRLPLLPASHAPYFRSYASCFTSSSNSSPAE